MLICDPGVFFGEMSLPIFCPFSYRIVCDIIVIPKMSTHKSPESYEYVTLHGTGDFVDVIKGKILRRGHHRGLPWRAQCHHSGTYTGKSEAGEGEVNMEAVTGVMTLMARRDREPKNEGSL